MRAESDNILCATVIAESNKGLAQLGDWASLNAENIKAQANAETIKDIVDMVSRIDPNVNRQEVAARAESLINLVRRDAEERAKYLTDEIQINRLDCFIFFFLIEFGWGKVVRYPSGAVVAKNALISGMRRLGYPTRHRLVQASKRVRQTCPQEAAMYKQASRAWREARKRCLAAKDEESWHWYVRGDGNRNSVAYRTKVDLSRKYGRVHFRTRRGFKYMLHELLPRNEERARAMSEMREAEGTSSEMRERIFEKMGVPPLFRSLA